MLGVKIPFILGLERSLLYIYVIFEKISFKDFFMQAVDLQNLSPYIYMIIFDEFQNTEQLIYSTDLNMYGAIYFLAYKT